MKQRWISAFLLLSILLAANVSADTIFPVDNSDDLAALLGNSANGVPDGGIIELAPGTYFAPDDGFLIFNPDRNFTVRAQTPGTAILAGFNTERILRFIVNNAALGGAVVFDGLTFRAGRSTQPAFGSAITMQGAFASFIDCLFEDNVNESNGSGSGTVGVQQGTTALFLRTTFADNTSKTSGAGLVVVNGSTMFCHECQFTNNRNNVADHDSTATGGGMVVTSESWAYLSNTRFEANQAGFAGGAIDVKGSFSDTAPARVFAANSTFVDNFAMPAAGVTTASPTAGGAINVEDNALTQFYNSRFLDNNAQFGGAIAGYRSTVEIYDSLLQGNFATGRESSNSTPRGGAIFAVSDDTAGDGNNNRPPVSVTIRNSIFHGLLTSARRGNQTAASHTGGCVYASGDIFRFLGLGGVPQGGSQAENSATVDITGTAFVDCDVEALVQDGALGGGLFSELSILNVDDSLFIDNNANGASGAGGGAALTRYANARLANTDFANNFAVRGGGAIFAAGAEIDVDSCEFFKNVVPGSTTSNSRGAAIFTGPLEGGQTTLSVEGVVRNSRFVTNQGLAIFEDDNSCSSSVFNFVTYENNDFFETTFPPFVYRNSEAGDFDANGLNNLFVNRGGGCAGTDKAPLNDNQDLSTQPVVGALVGAPPQVINKTAAGDTLNATESFLAFAWCGECAELDGNRVTTNTGLLTADSGVHSLMVFDNGQCTGAPDLDLTATINQAPVPTADLTADPIMIEGGGSSELTWDAPFGNFLAAAIDQGQGLLSTASGSTTVSPSLTTNYTFFAITQQGGATDQAKVFVDEEPDTLIFADGFESGNTSAWN